MLYNIRRDGAAGDCILVGSIISGLRRMNPDCTIIYFTKTPEVVKMLFGVDLICDSDRWDYRPKGIDLNMYYDTATLDKHIIAHFCDIAGTFWKDPILKNQDRIIEGDYITYQEISGWSTLKDYNFQDENI